MESFMDDLAFLDPGTPTMDEVEDVVFHELLADIFSDVDEEQLDQPSSSNPLDSLQEIVSDASSPEHDESSQEIVSSPEHDESNQEIVSSPEHDESNQEIVSSPKHDESSQEIVSSPKHDESNQEIVSSPEHDESNQEIASSSQAGKMAVVPVYDLVTPPSSPFVVTNATLMNCSSCLDIRREIATMKAMMKAITDQRRGPQPRGHWTSALRF